jgi:ribosomal protein S18 acetylase RimI-like enzyme
MKTELAQNWWQTAGVVAEMTAAAHRELGLRGVASRLCRRAAAPIVKWGAITFFERALQSPDAESGSPAAPGVFIRQLTESDLDGMLDGGDPDQDAATLERRFRRRDRAFGAVDTTGRICHVRWVSATRVHIPEIDRDIVLHPQQAYFYNGYTRRDARRRGIDSFARRAIFETLRSEGFTSVWSYVRTDNAAGLCAATRWQRPAGTIRYIALRGRKPIVMRSPAIGLPRLETALVID